MQLKIGKNLIVFIVVGLLILIGLSAGFVYLYNLNTQKVALRLQKENELNIAVAKINRLPKLKEEVSVLEAEEQRLIQFVPDKEGQAEFVWELQDLAEKSKITIVSCDIEKNFKKYQDNPEFKVYQWRVTISGRYSGLVDFLELLPRAKRSVQVSSLKINSISEDDLNRGNYKLNVEMMLDLITSGGEKVTK